MRGLEAGGSLELDGFFDLETTVPGKPPLKDGRKITHHQTDTEEVGQIGYLRMCSTPSFVALTPNGIFCHRATVQHNDSMYIVLS